MAITYGSQYEFNDTLTYITDVAVLDSTKAVVAYHDQPSGNYAMCKVANLSNENQLSYGSEYQASTGSIGGLIRILKIDSTHFVIIWAAGSTGYGRARFGTISGDTISYGTEATFHSANTGIESLVLIDSTHFLIAYKDHADSKGKVMIGTISGTSLSFGSEYTFNNANTGTMDTSMLSSTSFVVVFTDEASTNDGTAIIGTISGGSISFGSEYTFHTSTNVTTGNCEAIDSTHFAFTYYTTDSGTPNYIQIGTISAGVISFGSQYYFGGSSNMYQLRKLDSSRVIINYRSGGDSKGYLRVCTIENEDEISVGTAYGYSSTTINYGDGMDIFSVTTLITTQGSGGATGAQGRIGIMPAPTSIKSINGLARASVKSIKGLAIASVKSWNGLE